MAKTIIYFFTILISYFPKKSPSILLSVEPYLNFSVVIFKLLLKDNVQRQSVLCWAVKNMQNKMGYLKFWDACFFFIIMKLKCFVHACIFRVSQLKQARLKSEKKQKWDRLQVLPLSLDKNIREYLSERYALLTAKRFYFFRYIVFSGMVCGGYFETVIDGHSTYLQHFTYLIIVIYT